jgi:hypothetical protein
VSVGVGVWHRAALSVSSWLAQRSTRAALCVCAPHVQVGPRDLPGPQGRVRAQRTPAQDCQRRAGWWLPPLGGGCRTGCVNAHAQQQQQRTMHARAQQRAARGSHSSAAHTACSKASHMLLLTRTQPITHARRRAAPRHQL